MAYSSVHRFTCSEKGLSWLIFITVAFLVVIIFSMVVVFIYGKIPESADEVANSVIMIAIAAYAIFAVYCDWRTYLYAEDCSLEIDMITCTFTYKYKEKKYIFKSSDITHWYWDTGLYLSRISANHSIIVLKDGTELPVYCWLFEGNHFFLSDYQQTNACHFMSSHEIGLKLPQAEHASGYKYLLPPETK